MNLLISLWTGPRCNFFFRGQDFEKSGRAKNNFHFFKKCYGIEPWLLIENNSLSCGSLLQILTVLSGAV